MNEAKVGRLLYLNVMSSISGIKNTNCIHPEAMLHLTKKKGYLKPVVQPITPFGENNLLSYYNGKYIDRKENAILRF